MQMNINDSGLDDFDEYKEEFHRSQVVTGIEETVEGVLFSGKFCSGNLAKVIKSSSGEFNIWTRPDCAGTMFENTLSTWFFFSVKAMKNVTVRMCIMNLNKQTSLYQQHDYRPIFKVEPTCKTWRRMPDSPSFKVRDDNSQLRFKYRFESDSETAFFAFCYPFSYEDVQKRLSALDRTYMTEKSGEPTAAAIDEDIYYHRELLCYSHDRNRLDLVTISAQNGLLQEREPLIEPKGSMLHPLKEDEHRAFRFEPYKKVCFLTARVHPGETPASWTLEGAIRFLLGRDPRAVELRKRFVWKIIPLLNPDGVARGHYRSDTRGTNLNRVYHQPCPNLHCTIYAAKAAIAQIAAQERLALYIDMHAHANKRGCFLMGNNVGDPQKQVENVLYARLACGRSPHLEFSACTFSARSMVERDKRDGLSKEGSARVGIFEATRLTNCYTLECNYNRGRENTRVYTRESWLEVGRSLCLAMLDLSGASERACWGLASLPEFDKTKAAKKTEVAENEGMELLLKEIEFSIEHAGADADEESMEKIRELLKSNWEWKGPASDVILAPLLRRRLSRFHSLPPAEQPGMHSSPRTIPNGLPPPSGLRVNNQKSSAGRKTRSIHKSPIARRSSVGSVDGVQDSKAPTNEIATNIRSADLGSKRVSRQQQVNTHRTVKQIIDFSPITVDDVDPAVRNTQHTKLLFQQEGLAKGGSAFEPIDNSPTGVSLHKGNGTAFSQVSRFHSDSKTLEESSPSARIDLNLPRFGSVNSQSSSVNREVERHRKTAKPTMQLQSSLAGLGALPAFIPGCSVQANLKHGIGIGISSRDLVIQPSKNNWNLKNNSTRTKPGQALPAGRIVGRR